MSDLQNMFETITDNMRAFMHNMKGSGSKKSSRKISGKGTSRYSSKNVTQRIFNTYSNQQNIPNKKYKIPSHIIKIPSTSIPKYETITEISRSTMPKKHQDRVFLPRIYKEKIPHFTVRNMYKKKDKIKQHISDPLLKLPKKYKEKYYKRRYISNHYGD
jgi:hypothetical protein